MSCHVWIEAGCVPQLSVCAVSWLAPSQVCGKREHPSSRYVVISDRSGVDMFVQLSLWRQAGREM